MWLKKKTPWRRRKDEGGGEKCERDAPDSGPHSLLQPSGLGTAQKDRCSSTELERAAQAAGKNKVSLSAQTKHKQSPMKSVLFLLHSVFFPKFLLHHLILLEFSYTLNANFTITERVQQTLWTASGLCMDLHVSS